MLTAHHLALVCVSCCNSYNQLQARAKIRQVSLQLVHGWRGQPQQQQQQMCSHPAANGCKDQAGDATGVAAGVAAGASGAPGTFPSLMLSARDKEKGQQLTDEQVTRHEAF
jgi:hypothetical protein